MISLSIYLLLFFGCHPEERGLDRSSALNAQTPESLDSENEDRKGDELRETFPAERDLALVIPRDRAHLLALEVIPVEWLEAVDEALWSSELRESISEESWPEDWRLVSARISPCSPLGRIADPEEIDQLCWPGVRLVFQPLIERIPVGGLIRHFYADDRAIHALYRVQHTSPELKEIQELIAQGARRSNITEDQLARFESARNKTTQKLLDRVRALRLTEGPYNEIDDRPEFFKGPELENQFWSALEREILEVDCLPEALHELTAFSLPLGRQPASADLWSFVAFHAEAGAIRQVALEVLDARNGEVLMRFEGTEDELSEDVTSVEGDPQVLAALHELEGDTRAQLEAQVITNVAQNPTHSARIFDPYQTLVPHTTCSSCHRANNLLFNFHNFSYFEDQVLSVSPRTRADVRRDLDWIKKFKQVAE